MFLGWLNEEASHWLRSGFLVFKSVHADSVVLVVLGVKFGVAAVVGVARSGVKGLLGMMWEAEGLVFMYVTIGPRVGRHALVMPMHSSTMDQVTAGASTPTAVSLCDDTLEEDSQKKREDVHVGSKTWEEGENLRRK